MNLNSKGDMPLSLTDTERTYISKSEYITGVINSIAKKYPGIRQDSKAP